MKNIFLVYDNCCFYEIVILSYFMKFSQQDTILCSLDGKGIKCMEGYSVNIDRALKNVDINEVRCMTIPGGDISTINNTQVHEFVKSLVEKRAIVSAICAGVDVLDDAGVLKNIKSTHSEDVEVCRDKRIITARANAYVDFAIEVARELELFKDESDLQETIDFWKYHKRL